MEKNKHTVQFATLEKLWDKTFEGVNKFDVFLQVKQYAFQYASLTETCVYFSFENGDMLFNTDTLQQEESQAQSHIS